MELQLPHNICNILKAAMLRVLTQDQHVLINKPYIADAFNKAHLCAFCLPLLIKHLKKGAGCKITHLIAVSHNINGLSENFLPVSAVGFLCQGIIALLVRPQIQLWIKAPVKQLHRSH